MDRLYTHSLSPVSVTAALSSSIPYSIWRISLRKRTQTYEYKIRYKNEYLLKMRQTTINYNFLKS